MSLRSFAVRIMFGHSDRKRDQHLKIPEQVLVRRDIPYAPGGKEHLLDVVRPRNAAAGLPVIVSVHGGGYVYGTKEVYQHYAANLAENGFAVINFNYRLAPEYPFPAQLEDINSVLRWLEMHGAEYGLDLSNVFVVGDSAGAQLASHYLAILTDPDFAKLFSFQTPQRLGVRAVALNCGIYNIKPSQWLFADYLGKRIAPDDPRINVHGHITPAFPPAFVMTARYDFLREEAAPMYEHLLAAGVRAEYRLYGRDGQKYMGHVFHCNLNLAEARQCNKEECDFFRRHMASEQEKWRAI